MKRNAKIDSFFKPQNKVAKCMNNAVSLHIETCSGDTDLEPKTAISCDDSGENSCKSSQSIHNDIGLLVDETKCVNISRDVRYEMLKHYYKPDRSYVFPIRLHGSKRLTFQHHWLDRWNWLTYSKAQDGAYCRYCVLFSKHGVGQGAHQNVGCLVTKPFCKWKDAVEAFNNHQITAFHKASVISAESFITVEDDRMEDVACQINSQRQREIKENREALLPIIKTIIFCGEQELPLRGDIDSGPLTLSKPENKDGKFRALLRFRVDAGDQSLKKHLENANRNATYISPVIQNEVLTICGEIIQKNLVADVNKSKYFSVIADETLDVSGTEQISLCLRYVNSSYMLREDFVGFVPIYDLSGKNIAATIIKECGKLGLDVANIVGQGYDGASSMAGKFNGVQAEIKKLYPKALFVHCANHRLNLALSSAMSVTHIRNCLGTMSDVCNLFRNHSFAGVTLKNKINELLPSSKRSRLVGLCNTRFVERHDSVIVFVELLDPVVASLQSLSESSKSISHTAQQLLSAMEKSSFLISLLVCEKLLSFTVRLSTYLQNPQYDLSSALEYATDVIKQLKTLREDADEEFHKIFEKSSSKMKNLFDCEIKIPRLAGKQTMRDNYQAETPEEYFRRAIFIPCTEELISNLELRFETNIDVLSAFNILLPKNLEKNTSDRLNSLSSYFSENVSDTEVEVEYSLWYEKWKSTEKQLRPDNALSSLSACPVELYPTIHCLLKIFATLPVSTASAERSFSTMKRLKTYLRSKTGDERLTSLALLSVHWNQDINPEEVLNIMGRRNRRINL